MIKNMTPLRILDPVYFFTVPLFDAQATAAYWCLEPNGRVFETLDWEWVLI